LIIEVECGLNDFIIPFLFNDGFEKWVLFELNDDDDE
jgi:hypothetical protein